MSSPTGIEVAADWDTLESPETYLGHARGERRAGDGAEELALNRVGPRRAVDGRGGGGRARGRPTGSIAYRFQARDVNLVLTPTTPGEEVRFTVLLDGQPPGDAHGIDVNPLGVGTVSEPRLYQLVRQPGAVSEHTFEITFLDPGVRAYVFTFG